MSIRIVFFLFLLLSAVTVARSQQVCRVYANGAARLSADLEAKFKGKQNGFALVVLHRDSVVFSKGFGLADRQAKTTVTPSSPFYIASIAKSLTATSILLLRQQGKIQLDAKISTYFEDLPNVMQDVRVYHLLTHMSGIPDYYDILGENAPALDNAKVYEVLKKVTELKFQPGTDYSYSNSGYILLALLIEKLSGMSYAKFIDQKIITPLGMTNTWVQQKGEAIKPLAKVKGYHVDSLGKVTLDDYPADYFTVGSGGIYGSAEDLGKYISALTSGKIINQRSLNLLYDFPTTLKGSISYIGMGWMNESFGAKGGNMAHLKVFGSVGTRNGFRTNMVYVPDLELSYVILCNSGDFDLSYENIIPYFFK